MRNYYFITVLVGLLFMGCTVDNDELNLNDELETVNLEIKGDCAPSIYAIEDSGKLLGNVILTNSNEGDIAYVKFVTESGFYITEIKSKKVDQFSDLPKNNGGIIPGKLDSVDLNSVTEANLEFNVSSAESFILTAKVTLKNGDGKVFSAWIGNQKVGNNDSSYLIYNICNSVKDPTCTISAGADKSVTYTRAYVESRVSSSSDVEPLFYELVSEDATPGGTIWPGVGVILPSYEKNPYQTFTTKYTVTDGDCSDFAILSITIVDEIIIEDPTCTISAGEDKSVTYTRAYVESRVSSSSDVEPLFYELVSEDATPGGTIWPGVGVILPSYEKNPYQTFTTKYTVTDGDCSDFAILSITIVDEIIIEDPICTISAGADKSVTYTRAYVESRVSSSSDVEPLFYELVSEDATPGGTIWPGVGVILPSYEKNPYQTFTTKYTVTDGDCSDFAILSITVIP